MFKGIFPDCLKISSVVAVFKNIGEIYVPKNYNPVSLLPVASKVFEKNINNSLADYLEKCDILIIESNRVPRVFNTSMGYSNRSTAFI